MQQAGLKQFDLSHPFDLRRVGFLAVEPFEFSQLESYPRTGDPKHKVLKVFGVMRPCGGFRKQCLNRHALEGTPLCMRKIDLITVVKL
jgi:hypothetical protein